METNAIVLSYETGIIPASKKQIVIGIVKSYLDEFNKELPERVAESSTLVIKDQASRELATTRRQEASSALDAIAEKRKDLLGPPKKDIVEIEAMFNKIQKQITTIKDNYNTEIGRDFMEQRRIKAEQEAILAAEAEKQRLQAQEALIAQAIDQNDESLLEASDNVFVPQMVLAEPERTTHTDAGSTNVRMDIEISVLDKPTVMRSIAKCDIPFDFANIDLAYIKKYAKNAGWKPGEMFGLKISEVPIISGRTK